MIGLILTEGLGNGFFSGSIPAIIIGGYSPGETLSPSAKIKLSAASSPIVFNDYDTSFDLAINVDGEAIGSNIVTRVVLWIPGDAFADGLPQLADTDDLGLTLNTTKTTVTVDLSDFDIIPGRYSVRATVFDASTVRGIPAGSLSIRVLDWNSTV